MRTRTTPTTPRRTPLTFTPSEAWRRFHPELLAVTVENWNEADYEDDPEKRPLAAAIEAGNLTPAVLSEVQSCLDRDWCAGPVHDAALVVLATHGRLDPFDPHAVYSRRMRTRVINGTRYIV